MTPEQVLGYFKTVILDDENFENYHYYIDHDKYEMFCGNYTLDENSFIAPIITYGCMHNEDDIILELPNGELENLDVFCTRTQNHPDNEKLEKTIAALKKYHISCFPVEFDSFLERYQYIDNYQSFPQVFTQRSPSKYAVIPYYYACFDEKEQKWSMNETESKLLKKEGCLVAEQKGASLENLSEVDNIEFKLHFNGSEYSENYEEGYGILTFYSDHTVSIVGDNNHDFSRIYPCTWEMSGDHFLCVEATYHVSTDRTLRSYCCFYLDFDTNEVFIPAMIRCNAAWELHQEITF